MDNIDLLKVYEFYNKKKIFIGLDPYVIEWFEI